MFLCILCLWNVMIMCYVMMYCIAYAMFMYPGLAVSCLYAGRRTSLRRMSGNTQPLTATRWLRHTFPEIRVSVIWLLTAGPIGHHLLSPAVNDSCVILMATKKLTYQDSHPLRKGPITWWAIIKFYSFYKRSADISRAFTQNFVYLRRPERLLYSGMII